MQGQVVWFSFDSGETTRCGMQILRGPRPFSSVAQVDVQRKRQPHASVGTASERQGGIPGSSSRQQWSPQPNVLRISKSPDEVRKCAFSKVARLQAAIASLDDQTIRSSLQQARKRAQQQTVLAPVDQHIADCILFIERAKKRVQIAEADVKKAVEARSLREGELAVAEQRLVDLQQEAARAEAVPSSSPPTHRTVSRDLPANKQSPSRVGFRDSEVAHRGCQVQGTCGSTSEGFGRSSPDCASGRGETPRRVDGRHAHRRTES